MDEQSLNRKLKEKKTIAFNTIIDFFAVLYIISVYIFSFNEFNIFSKALAFVLMFLLAIYVLGKKSIHLNGLAICLGLFTFFCFLSCFWALDATLALSKSITMVQIFILVALLSNYMQKENKVEQFIAIMCIATTVFSIYTVFYVGIDNYFTGLEEGSRLGWGINNVNAIGMMAATGFLVNLWYVFYMKKWWFLITGLICLIVSLGSGSRTALIGMVLGIIALFVLKGKSLRKIVSILQCVGILVVLYLILKLPAFEIFMERIELMIDGFLGGGKADGSAETRFDMIELGWETFFKNPIGGIGIGNSAVITSVYDSSTYLHNNYAELLATTGIIGTFLYYLMFLTPFFKMLKNALKQNSYAILCVVLIFVNLIFHVGTVDYYDKVSYLYLVLIWSIAFKKEGDKNEKIVESN